MDNSVAIDVIFVASMMAITLSFEYLHLANRLKPIGYTVFNFLLFMMLDMYISLAWYLQSPMNFLYTVAFINFVMFPMFSYLVLLIFLHNRNPWNKWPSIIYFSALIVISEFFMSVDILELSGFKFTISSITLAVGSPYFLIPMAGEMILGPLMKNLIPLERLSILFSGLMMLVIPTTLPSLNTYVLIVDAILMIAVMATQFEIVSSSKYSILNRTRKIINFSFTMMLVSASGIFFYSATGSVYPIGYLPFSIAMIVFMIIYLHILFMNYGSETKISWYKNKKWLFYLLLSSFLAEILYSAAIDIDVGVFSIQNTWSNAVVYLLTNNVPYWNVNFSLINLLLFVAVTANSFVFLMIMGSEMIILVLFRMRTIKWREKRINLSLAIASYLLYTFYGPNFIAGWSKLPLWGNVGALGPLTKYVLLPVIGSYILYGVLAILFGRRSYCSTLCPSAVMYGGTLGESMVSLNYGTKISKKNLGSRFSKIAKSLIAGSWVFFVLSAILSLLNSLGIVKIPFDPAVIFSLLIWNLLWYIFFISIPFVGMSPCRRYGWCTTGTFVGLLSYIGFFKIVAKDPMQCYRCPTKDCVTACEVGISDIPAQLIKKGYFKSIKCVGSGSCIMACPYENIRFSDVRDLIRPIISKNSEIS